MSSPPTGDLLLGVLTTCFLIFVICALYALHADDRSLLAALIAEGGRDIKEQSVRRRLIREHGFEKNRASEVLRNRRTVLSGENLVQLRHNIYDGDEMSLHPYWEWYVRHATGLASPGDHGA